ncbi:MAG TPA: tetratricopeptide repeat protein [Chthonomonadaceae bacterium]|nr:tetratricopeptide repeat protein [Chthonomonadaceae bacterium]
MKLTDFEPIIQQGDIGQFNEVLHQFRTSSTGDEDWRDLIFSAAWACQAQIVEALINLGVDPNYSNEFGETACHIAAGNGNLDLLRLLIRAGADVNARTTTQESPLHYCVNNGCNHDPSLGYTAIMTFLCDHDADINAQDDNGQTPLHGAITDAELVSWFVRGLSQPVGPPPPQLYEENRPYHRTMFNMASILLRRGANTELRGVGGYTPISAAIRYAPYPIVELLIKHRSITNESSRQGDEDLIDVAARLNRKDVLALLTGTSLSGNAAELYYNQAIAYLNAENWKASIDSFNKVLSIQSDHQNTWFLLGCVYQQTGQLSEAAQAFEQATRLSPEDGQAHSQLGNIYLLNGRYQEAERSLKEAIRLGDVSNAYCSLGDVYRDTYRYREAVEAYGQAIQLQPTLAEAHFFLGLVHCKIGNIDQAIEEYRTLQSLNPGMAQDLRKEILALH